MPDDTQDFAAVESILTERDALHEWLVRLDAAGGSTPQAVRARVRVDYERRLEAVVSRLQQHTDGIAARLSADRNEHTDLSSRAQVSRDALAEAELRHAVGEYDAARFEQERSRHVGDLETFELSLGAVADRIAKMDAIQQLISKVPSRTETAEAATAGAFPAAVIVQDTPTAAVSVSSREQPEFKESTAAVPEEASDDGKIVDDAFLAVFEAAEDEAKKDLTPLDHRGGLSFTPTGEFRAPREPVVPPGSPPLGMPETDQRPRFVRPGTTRGSELAEAEEHERGTRGQMAAALDVGTVELQPEPVLPEPAVDVGPRTLRCGECGAMNRPLEWYCEKCGAELTAG